VLHIDLGRIDPRRLADGKPEEINFIADLLCRLGKQKGLFDDEWVAEGEDGSMRSDLTVTERIAKASTSYSQSRIPPPRATSTPPPPPIQRVLTPALSLSPHSSISQTFDAISIGASTSVTSEVPVYNPNGSSLLPSRMDVEGETCQCSMSLDDTFLSGTTFCHCSIHRASPPPSPPSRPASAKGFPIRYHGWINRVDDVGAFESSSLHSSPRTPSVSFLL